ncbi:GTP-binding protein-like protein 2 [Amylocarpus encephaloides]|uniref:GTP-binding protein-like protein 2 n=1 Tax=Amylocarpus encephaloides TaxID=45428 RepID=A0A9P8C9N6_9HELO|nr:GTP-binding protein-like protein 2 [Amylocarpus encephaloides]
MASIFTYDPDPPRVASPWLTPIDTPKASTPQPRDRVTSSSVPLNAAYLSDYGVTRLQAEPQEGPTEYKLHLLLRPRRSYSSSSTVSNSLGQPARPETTMPILAPSNHSRQNRLEQLTTQLLWRLQQSAPYHASTTGDLVLPQLPESASSLETPTRPAKLLAGLEESRGALYEIGVSDDGAFCGLTEDEMDESLTNLKAMAASLGCNVEIVRMVVVGNCEWHDHEPSPQALGGEPSHTPSTPTPFHDKPSLHQAQLWVAEALVTPDLSSRHKQLRVVQAESQGNEQATYSLPDDALQRLQPKNHEATEQLRVTLTGPTASGKSSLLGTLSTATLDNGRGKSRLSLLKHRHEIASGMTSSVAQELLGYQGTNVLNFASGNVSSWTDIHASAEHGRLVLVSDSAGHPRYRRTTVRGLVGWAPHWTLLCIAADDAEHARSGAGGTSSAQEILGVASAGVDLAKAHLELCLQLDKPLAIVITKLDLASKSSLRQTLSKILTAVKSVGRVPSMIPPDNSKVVSESDLAVIPEGARDTIQNVIDQMAVSDGSTSIVPIIMTSSAKGSGIGAMHSLLQRLPIPPVPTSHDYVGPVLNPEQPSCLFHIEDVFGLPAAYEPLASNKSNSSDSGVVIAGHMRFGRLAVGDAVVIGPFPAESDDEEIPLGSAEARSSPNSFGATLPHPSTTELERVASRNFVSASVTKGEWHNAQIVSVRNLRLPVHTLGAGQVGTLGIVFEIPPPSLLISSPFEPRPFQNPRVRKGMVVAIPSKHMMDTGHTLQAASGFTASFEDGDINSVTPGSLVVVYIASIRATAKILRVAPHEENGLSRLADQMEDVFGLDDPLENENELEPLIFGSDGITDLKFELITTREWIELGSQILVMPGGGHGLYYGSERGEKGVAGLEGFVGRVTEVVD